MQPTPKFDPHFALALVRTATGVELAFDGMCPGGEVGAAYVRWSDGRRSVLGGGNPASGPLTALARSAGIPAPLPLYLTESGPGFCVHESLDRSGGRTRRLLAWVREVGAETDTMTGTDLVHLDYHPGNVLVDGGRVTGIIDWDGAARGDHRFDLVTLRFSVPQLDGLLRELVPADVLRPWWAHMSLRLVDWALRHHGAAEVDHWLDVAESGLD